MIKFSNLIMAGLLAAIPSGAEAQSTAENMQGIDETPLPQSTVQSELQSIPMTVDRWKNMTDQGKQAYSQASIEALRWGRQYYACKGLNASWLIGQINLAIDALEQADNAEGPLMIPFAIALEQMCPITQ